MGGKVARKAQVALFVLLGFILLMGVILAIYLMNKQEVTTTASPEELYAGNPELAAEAGRMQQRVEECLEDTLREIIVDVEEYGVEADTLDEARAVIDAELQQRFPNCFFEYNTADKLDIISDNEPDTTVILGGSSLTATVKYRVRGSFQEDEYFLSDYSASVDTDLRELLETAQRVEREIEEMAAGLDVPEGLISPDGYINPYVNADKNQYYDVLFYPDGTCTIFVSDYSKVVAEESDVPETFSFTPETICLPDDEAIGDPVTILPAASQTCTTADCAIPFSEELPEGFVIISDIYIDPITWTLDATQYAPGEYLVLASATGEEADDTIMQGLVITIGGAA